jgi:thiamine-phosphate pyrophosphorylase
MNQPSPQVLRLLDANVNRAREALRVVEDYARFVLDDQPTCAALKQLRHDLTGVTAKYARAGILYRDTPGDVGTETKTEAELSRAGESEVVVAAGKRLGEALRSIEEYLKVVDANDASAVERLRYRFYDAEHQLAFALRAGGGNACGFVRVRLYVLISESACRRSWLETAEQAILGGADCLQLREKDLDGAEFLRRATQFVQLCRRHKVISIINDRPDIALLSGADGVHVGQDDLPAREVRKLIGPDRILGVSTHNLDQAKRAFLDGADYIGVGPVYRSGTKPRDWATIPGLDFARQAAAMTPRISTVAIAGVTPENVDEVMATGVQAVAVTAAVVGQEDIAGAARRLKDRIVTRSTGFQPVPAVDVKDGHGLNTPAMS